MRHGIGDQSILFDDQILRPFKELNIKLLQQMILFRAKDADAR